jgi:aspartate carbamoyltransferase catalytic subunit
MSTPATKWRKRDVISAKEFSREDLERLFDETDKVMAKQAEFRSGLRGKIVATLFFEKSTRTRDSFCSAVQRMDGRVIGFAEPEISSVGKGESLRDTIRMYDSYSDAIILRHPKAGAAKFAAEIAKVPVINAGDGNREHPTQAMLDLFTIRKSVGRLDSLKVGVLGDLRYGRTCSSLSYALANFDDVELTFIAPEIIQVRPEVELFLRAKRVEYSKTTDPREVLGRLDVLYVTRIQKERFADISEFEKVRGSYIVDKKLLQMGKPDLKVMHPLPRIDEIPLEVDETPNAVYIGQAENGLYVRMALLNLILGGIDEQ